MANVTEPSGIGDTSRSGPLRSIGVVEFAGLGPGPFVGMLLADLGAAVTRVVRPGRVDSEGGRFFHRGKAAVTCDLKTEDGHSRALDLICTSDVLIDPFRPGVMERLGLGPETATELNPALIYARLTGWGQDGPLAHRAGHDINYLALAGALEPLGEPEGVPRPPLNLVADFGGGGLLAAFGISTALYERDRSGQGQVVDIAMIDGVASMSTSILAMRAEGNWSGQRGSHWLQGAAHWYGVYRTLDDRFLSVGALEPEFYAQFLARLGLPAADWPQHERTLWPELRTRLEAIFLAKTGDEWMEVFADSDCCVWPALNHQELLAHPHLAERGVFVDPGDGLQPAPAPRFSRTPGRIHSRPSGDGSHHVHSSWKDEVPRPASATNLDRREWDARSVMGAK